MRKLIFVFVLITIVCQTGFSQRKNFYLGVSYSSEFERYPLKQENVSGQIVSSTRFGQNNSIGLLLNYSLKNRISFETGIVAMKRHYEQQRAFNAQSFFTGRWVSDNLVAVQSYFYTFIDIPLSTKIFLAHKDAQLKPFLNVGAKLSFLENAKYSTYGNGYDYSDAKQTYWGKTVFGGLGMSYFWKDFIFEANANYRFMQKYKEDARFLEVNLIKFDDNDKQAFSLGATVYHNFDFKKKTPPQ